MATIIIIIIQEGQLWTFFTHLLLQNPWQMVKVMISKAKTNAAIYWFSIYKFQLPYIIITATKHPSQMNVFCNALFF